MRTVTVSQPQVPEGAEWIIPVNDLGHERVRNAGYPTLPGTWAPLLTSLKNVGRGVPKMKGADAPWLNDAFLVFRGGARQRLGNLLDDYGHFLELKVDKSGESYWMFQALVEVDALDEASSEIKRFTSGKIMDIRRFEFRVQALQGLDVFKVPQSRTLFFTDAIASTLEGLGFSGLRLKKVWSNREQE